MLRSEDILMEVRCSAAHKWYWRAIWLFVAVFMYLGLSTLDPTSHTAQSGGHSPLVPFAVILLMLAYQCLRVETFRLYANTDGVGYVDALSRKFVSWTQIAAYREGEFRDSAWFVRREPMLCDAHGAVLLMPPRPPYQPAGEEKTARERFWQLVNLRLDAQQADARNANEVAGST
jgi:hypothetical protein